MKSPKVLETKELSEALESTGCLTRDVAEKIRKGACGPVADLQELQSALVQIARDATDAACCLFVAIRTAESRDKLAKLDLKLGA